MKKQIIYLCYSILFIAVSSLLFSSLLAIIKYNWNFDEEVYTIIINILATMIFCIAGFIYAFGIKKKAMLHALAFVGIYFIVLALNFNNITSYLMGIIRSSAYIIGTIAHYLLKVH